MASPELAAQIAALSREVERQRVDNDSFKDDVTAAWLVICGSLVFFMQTGFAMLETGVVSKLNIVSVMFKNLLDSCIAGLTFWLVGYAFAYGDDAQGFIGTSDFGLSRTSGAQGTAFWFFQWGFAGASATIVSGAVCERIMIKSYIAFTIWMCVLIYPVVAHWVWGGGWLSRPDGSQNPDGPSDAIFGSNGVLDFAGSGVVHMVGGVAALTGAIFLKPRIGRFDPETGKPRELEGHNKTLMVLGTGVLAFGWYGFNCGCVGHLQNNGAVVAVVAVNTTVALSAGGFAGILISLFCDGRFELQTVLNSLLAGLVSINASVDFAEQWAVCIIAGVGALVYFGTRNLLLRFRIDDPLEASAVHGAAGAWGLLAAGMFCTDSRVYPEFFVDRTRIATSACTSGTQFGAQVVGVVAIAAYTAALSTVAWGTMQYLGVLRVPSEWEEIGMDNLEHGTEAYPSRDPQLGLMLEAGGVNHGAQLYVNDQYLSGGKANLHFAPSRDPSGRFEGLPSGGGSSFVGSGLFSADGRPVVYPASGGNSELFLHQHPGVAGAGVKGMERLSPGKARGHEWGHGHAPVHLTVTPVPQNMEGYYPSQGWS
mmetsp:Transcript_17183/g.43429  ORF Transcript_17183/g.43429 Transcript_17183/m.43429 type:complete len:594 (+) Transcript_17183:15-1796(+)